MELTPAEFRERVAHLAGDRLDALRDTLRALKARGIEDSNVARELHVEPLGKHIRSCEGSEHDAPALASATKRRRLRIAEMMSIVHTAHSAAPSTTHSAARS